LVCSMTQRDLSPMNIISAQTKRRYGRQAQTVLRSSRDLPVSLYVFIERVTASLASS
jgi:hypothetical protein